MALVQNIGFIGTVEAYMAEYNTMHMVFLELTRIFPMAISH